MAKRANAGELRTPIIVEELTEMQDVDGYPVRVWFNVFGRDNKYHVKWVNVHGAEVYESMSLNLKEPATLTGRYSPLITPQCRITKVGDPEPYEIISIDDVENRHQWLEIKVQRMVSAR
jgi:head-tail adaptor